MWRGSEPGQSAGGRVPGGCHSGVGRERRGGAGGGAGGKLSPG